MDHMAGALTELGVGKGDRVTVFAHNGLDYLIAMFGAWRIGAIAPCGGSTLPCHGYR